MPGRQERRRRSRIALLSVVGATVLFGVLNADEDGITIRSAPVDFGSAAANALVAAAFAAVITGAWSWVFVNRSG